MRILLVEDDDVLRDGIVAGLGLEGFQVDAVACLADARAAIGDHAGVVLDIGLPDGSGLDLLAEWRRAGDAGAAPQRAGGAAQPGDPWGVRQRPGRSIPR